MSEDEFMRIRVFDKNDEPGLLVEVKPLYQRLREIETAVRDVNLKPTEPITWDTVRRLNRAGLYETADVAQYYVLKYERHHNRWFRRLGRWLRG